MNTKLNEQLRLAGWSPSDLNNDSFFSSPSLPSPLSNLKTNMDVILSPLNLSERLSYSNPNSNQIDKKRGKASSFSTPINNSNSIERVSKILNNRDTPLSIKPINLAFNTIDLTTSPPNVKDIISSDSINSTNTSSLSLSNNNNDNNSNNNQKIILLDLTTAFSQQSINNNLSILQASNQKSNNKTTKPIIKPKEKFINANQIMKQNNEHIEFSHNKENKLNLNNNNKSMLPSKNTEIKKYISQPAHNLKELLLEAANLDEVLPNGWELYRHQKEAIIQCLEMGRTILSFDMGLGKTLVSLIYAKAVAKVFDCLTIVVCPVSLTEIWSRDSIMLGFDIVQLSTKLKDKKVIDNENINKSKVIIVSWAKIIETCEIERLFGNDKKFVVLCDEAHAMQTLKSQRTQAVLELCLAKNCIGTILATGTPMKNGRPSNIYPLLVAIRHSVSKNKIEFEKKYCNAKKTRFCIWDITGASNLTELRSIIGKHLLRKTKDECLELPPLVRKLIDIKIPKSKLYEYKVIIKEMKIKMKYNKGTSTSGINTTALELMGKLRSFSSISKVIGTGNFIVNKLNIKRDPIVVFVWFKETAYHLNQYLITGQKENEFENKTNNNIFDFFHDDDNNSENDEYINKIKSMEIKSETLTGDILDYKARQLLVDKFQSGDIDVLICTYGVGSTGLTLTKSHTVILLDRPWTPADVLQAEDRINRIGQKSDFIESIWIEGFDIDKTLDKMLMNKDNLSQKVLADGLNRKWFQESTSQPATILNYFQKEKSKDINEWNANNDNDKDEDNENSTTSIMSMVLKSLI